MRQGAGTGSWGLIATVACLTVGLGGAFIGCGGDDDVTLSTSTTSSGGGEGGQGGGLNCVIDGMLGGTEECDDGNEVDGDGCDNDCSFTCTAGTPNGDAVCDDTDPCNGVETCTPEHTCSTGTPSPDGTPCGQGKICKGGVCGDDTCGDGFVSASEECDDGNIVDGDGCDSCQFSCESSDPGACTPADPCQGQGVCDDATHTCSPGTPLPDGTSCGMTSYCSGGVCTAAVCGNGVLDPNEACDDGNLVNGDGCDMDCTLSCVDPTTDCPAAQACRMQICSMTAVCQEVADPSQDGMPCGMNLVCSNGACLSPSSDCGNGVVELGEQCDFGTANGPNTGCETDCSFSCTMSPDSCPDGNACNGTEVCTTVTVNNQTGQACMPGTPLPPCSACPGGLCVNGTCAISVCGDGCVDPGNNEQCEPPNTSGCSMNCTTLVCGNGVREGNEQCDDGNTTNLDGCDSGCRFEQSERANWLKMQFSTDTYCTANRLGSAIVGGTAQSQIQTAFDDAVADGSISILFKVLGLDDLSGTSDAAIQLGVVNGSPETNMGMLPYDGTNDLDWWYNVDPLSIDANRNPTALLPGSIAAKVVNAGPGSLTMTLLFGGNPAPLKMSNVKVTGTIGGVGTPTASSGNPPGHLSSENLDPALTSYVGTGQQTANGSAKLCGNVSAASLALVPIPEDLTGGGLLACSQNYSISNSMLDLLIGGCTVLFIQQIAPRQPDQQDPDAPPVGNGPNYTLSASNSQTKVVDTCRDANNQVVNLQACLNDAAYSSFFKLATSRVILK